MPADRERTERLYGIAGRAAGEAALTHGRDGGRLRYVTDAFVLSRIARAIVDAILAEPDPVADAARGVVRIHHELDQQTPPPFGDLYDAIDALDAAMRR